MKVVNRQTVVVVPKQPFLDGPNALEDQLGTGERTCTVFHTAPGRLKSERR